MKIECPNTLCAYHMKDGSCPLFGLALIDQCVCKIAFEEFSRTVDIDREFESGCGSYHQWQEIKRGDLPI